MHKDGSLADLLSQKKVLVEEENPDANEVEHTEARGDKSGGDVEGEKADEVRAEMEQSTGARSKDAKGESS